MSTQKDKNYKSYDGQQEDVSNVVLDPIAAGWQKGSWQDTAKFWEREWRTFENFEIVNGGTEDALDVSSRNNNNLFLNFKVAAGDKYVLTLKGSSSNNIFKEFIITKPGKWVEIQIGNWSDDDLEHKGWARSKNNAFLDWKRTDGKPIRYAYRFGCKPLIGNGFKHLWWMSIGLTIYWCAKRLIKMI
jgi:hypothetical protein